MKVKKGDTVVIISGKDRLKTGTIVRALPKEDKVLIDGINVVTRHRPSRRPGSRGQLIKKPMPIHVSNVALKDPKGGKPTRVGYTVEKGKKVRVARKSGETIS